MPPEEFVLKMEEIENQYKDDPELSHVNMDNPMCEVLMSLGYGDGITIFEESDKMYA